MNIGYIRSYNNESESAEIQKVLLERYSDTVRKIDMYIYEEPAVLRSIDEKSELYQKAGYSRQYRGEKCYNRLDDLAILIIEGQVENIVVDTSIRLRVNPAYNNFFETICRKNDVNIHEISEMEVKEPGVAVLYHSISNKVSFSESTLKSIDNIYEYCSNNQIHIGNIYIDEDTGKYNQKSLKTVIERITGQQILVTYEFMKIIRPTGSFIEIMKRITSQGSMINTIKNGSYVFSEDNNILAKNMTAFFYDNYSMTTEDADLQIKIVELFIEMKTQWSLCGRFWAEGRSSTVRNRIKLPDGTTDKAEIIIIKNFSALNDRITSIEDLLNELRVNQILYSLEEGCYFYGKQKGSILCKSINSQR